MGKLNTYRIRIELAKLNKNYTWLAGQMGYTRQYIHHIIKNKNVKFAGRIANIFNLGEEELKVGE